MRPSAPPHSPPTLSAEEDAPPWRPENRTSTTGTFLRGPQDQAAAHVKLGAERWNGPLDTSRLAEEVEDLGKAERNALLGRIERLILHL